MQARQADIDKSGTSVYNLIKKKDKSDMKLKRRLTKTLEFKIFCFEAYKARHGLKGVQTLEEFERFGVFEYLTEFYDVPRAFGKEYLVDDIDRFIEKRRTA